MMISQSYLSAHKYIDICTYYMILVILLCLRMRHNVVLIILFITNDKNVVCVVGRLK